MKENIIELGIRKLVDDKPFELFSSISEHGFYRFFYRDDECLLQISAHAHTSLDIKYKTGIKYLGKVLFSEDKFTGLHFEYERIK